MIKLNGSAWLLVLICGFVIIEICESGVTVEQMEKGGTMIRGVCLPKSKASEDLVNGIKDGKFPNEKTLKCYVQCALEMSGIMKKNKLLYDAAIKQMDLLLPDELKEPNKKSLEICKDSVNGIKDPCDAAYAAVQCFYKNNDRFMFP